MILVAIVLAVLAIHFPGWATLLLWSAVSLPLLAMVAHLKERARG